MDTSYLIFHGRKVVEVVLGVLYKSSLKLISVKLIHYAEFESMNITLKQSNQHVLHIILLYRPPTFSANFFLEPFNTILQEASVLGEHVIICGDFNTHYNNERCPCNLAQLIDQCGFQQSVQSPTHARGDTLDLIITPLRSNILVSKPGITVQIYDHFVVECYVNFKKPRTHTLTYRSIDSERFSSDLLSATQYVDTITDFNTSVQSVLDAHALLTSRVVIVVLQRLREGFVDWSVNIVASSSVQETRIVTYCTKREPIIIKTLWVKPKTTVKLYIGLQTLFLVTLVTLFCQITMTVSFLLRNFNFISLLK